MIKTRVGLSLSAWLGGFILGALLSVLALVIHSVLLLRLGLLLIAVAMLAEVTFRVLTYQAAGKMRSYAWISVGIRLVVAAALVYLVAGFHL